MLEASLQDLLTRTAQATRAPLVTIGNFDGVHLGHQAILRRLRERADTLQADIVALTFEPHPVILFKGRDPKVFRLTDPEHKVALLRDHGVAWPLLVPFTRAFAGLTPEAFVREVLHAGLGAREVWVGYDFNFGRDRAGDPAALRRFGEPLGLSVHVHDVVEHAEGVVSSTRVRKLLADAKLSEAARLLGRDHALRGVVEHGAKRGRGIGFPTANIHPQAGLMVPYGVYTTRVRLLDAPDTTLPGITNVGVRPTVADEEAQPNAESFILDGLSPDADIYDRPIEVELIEFIRPEQKFDSLDALKTQIGRDVQRARATHGLTA